MNDKDIRRPGRGIWYAKVVDVVGSLSGDGCVAGGGEGRLGHGVPCEGFRAGGSLNR